MGKLNKSGKIYLIKSFFAPFFMGAMFFWALGHIDFLRGWIFIAMTAVHVWVAAIILAIYNPEVLNERQDMLKKKDTKTWDWFLLFSYGIMQFYIQTIIMGFDIGSAGPTLGVEYVVPGVVLFLASVALIIWAMTENPFFESTVRIQKDRKQRVIRTGPYAIVRHPGYVAALLWAFAGPLIVGSLIGLVPGAVAAAILVLRTYMEDKTLHKELDGYKEYAKKVKYKIIPGIW